MYGTVYARDRPAGVTVLVILHVIVGIIAAFTGLLLFVAYARPSSLGGFTSFAVSIVGVASSYGYLVLGVGVLWFVFSVFSFVLVYGLWKGQPWGWLVSLVLASDGIIIGALGVLLGIFANALALIVYGVILIYLFFHSVRIFFGLVQPYPIPYPPYVGVTSPSWNQARSQVAHGQPVYPQFQQMVAQGVSPGVAASCPVCRAPLPYNSPFCSSCGSRLV